MVPPPCLRHQSSKLSLHIRSFSGAASCSSSYSALAPRLPFARFRPILTSPTLSSSISPCQKRSLVTKLVRPFSRSRASHAQPEQRPGSIQPSPPATSTQPLPLTNLPYFIRRTPSNQLPVYLETKAGGTRQLTRVQRTEGDMDALRDDLVQALGVDSADVQVNRLNGHIVVKGWRKPEIQQFLLDRKF